MPAILPRIQACSIRPTNKVGISTILFSGRRPLVAEHTMDLPHSLRESFVRKAHPQSQRHYALCDWWNGTGIDSRLGHANLHVTASSGFLEAPRCFGTSPFATPTISLWGTVLIACQDATPSSRHALQTNNTNKSAPILQPSSTHFVHRARPESKNSYPGCLATWLFALIASLITVSQMPRWNFTLAIGYHLTMKLCGRHDSLLC